jgi:hypothetical protein
MAKTPINEGLFTFLGHYIFYFQEKGQRGKIADDGLDFCRVKPLK